MNDRGQSIVWVFGLLILFVVSAFYIPFIVDDVQGDRKLGPITQTEGEEITVYHELNSTLSDIAPSTNNVTLTFEDTNTRNTTEDVIVEGVEETIEIEGEEIVVNATVISSSTAEMTYVYPVDYGWPVAMKTVVDHIAVIIMGMIVFIGIGLFFWE